MKVIAWLILLSCCYLCDSFCGMGRGRFCKSWSQLRAVNMKAPILLPPPAANTVANFGEYSPNDDLHRFIPCNLLAAGEIESQKYGVGYPVNMPVMLTYFEKNELKPVRPTHPDYEHLLDHVSLQLDNSDLQLFRTPVVLTLEGEFDDEEFNQVDPFQLYETLQSNKRRSTSTTRDRSASGVLPHHIQLDDDEVGDEEREEEEAEEVSLEELMHSENISGNEEAYDASDIEEEEEEIDESGDGYEDCSEEEDYDEEEGQHESGESHSKTTDNGTDVAHTYKESEPNDSFADITSINRPPPEFPEIAEEDLVTEEDTKSLNRAHRRADKIIEYADDVKLMGSFHFKKKNYHLVRLLEPIFLMGRKLEGKKGDDFYALLDQQETETIRPILEKLLLERGRISPEVAPITDRNQGNERRSRENKKNSACAHDDFSSRAESSAPSGYNKWHSQDSDRHRTDGNKHFARQEGAALGGRSNAGRSVHGGNLSARSNSGRRNSFSGKSDGGTDGRAKRSGETDVDDDQFESAREKWQGIKKNTDRR